MAEGDKAARLFRSHDSGKARCFKHITLRDFILGNEFQGPLFHMHGTARNRFPLRNVLGCYINH